MLFVVIEDFEEIVNHQEDRQEEIEDQINQFNDAHVEPLVSLHLHHTPSGMAQWPP